MPARNRRSRHNHPSASSRYLAEHCIPLAVAAQVHHRPLAPRPLEAPLDQRTRYTRLLRWKDADLFFHMRELLRLHRALENRLVKSLRPVQITGGNLEPRPRRRPFRSLLAHNFLLYLVATPEA